MLIRSLFKNIFFKIFLVVVLLLTALYQAFWISYENPENWRVYPIHSIQLIGEDWQAFDIKMPSLKIQPKYSLLEPDIAIPSRYRLETDKYAIDVVVNPSGREWFTTLEFVASRIGDGKILRIESQWEGNCGKVAKVSEKKRWSDNSESKFSWGHPFLTDLRATGFIWYRFSEHCKQERPQTPEYDSQFPIIFDIYDGETLIGRKNIPFKIFQNGIRRSQVTF